MKAQEKVRPSRLARSKSTRRQSSKDDDDEEERDASGIRRLRINHHRG